MSDRAERETKSGVWWHGNLGVKPFLNQRGSTLVLLSFVLSTLTGVGIFYGLSQATDFNILGNERRMFLSDAAIEFAIDEIASFYDTQLASLPENAKENGAKGPVRNISLQTGLCTRKFDLFKYLSTPLL